MKLARLLFCLLLAVLLPLQGAVAAAMPCPHEVTPSLAHEVTQPDDSMTGHGQMLDTGGMEHMHQHAHAAQKAGKCGLCAACCSGAALTSAGLTDLQIAPTSTATFRATRSPDTSFLSDGQERPPRSC